MSALYRMLRSEAALVLTSSWGRGILFSSAGLAVCCAAMPVVLFGLPYPLGDAAVHNGVTAGSALASLAGPAVCVFLTGNDFDSATRRVRHVSGASLRKLSLAQVAVALITVASTVLASAVLTVLATSGDAAARSVLQVADKGGVPVLLNGLSIRIPLLATVMTWLLILALRSGRKALVALVALFSTWFVGMVAIGNSSAAGLLALHPLAWIWDQVSSIDVPWLDPAVSPSLSAVVALLWLAALIAFAVRSSGR